MANLTVILVKTRFPENIGMAARACANMGCPSLWLVAPERWDRQKALPTATPQASEILDSIKIHDRLEDAVKDFQYVLATTARLGGWRKSWLTPEAAACETGPYASARTGILFGPEDRGLNNDELAYAEKLIHIPTATGATSLNLAQSVLLVLYAFMNNSAKAENISIPIKTINYEKQMLLEENLKSVLLRLDCIHGHNPEYFFRLWREMLRRIRLKPHEYDALMGFCRQLRRKLD